MVLSLAGSRRRRDPFEILFSAVFAVSGAMQLITGAKPGSVAELLPGWFRIIWLGMMTAGAIGVLLGVFWRNPAGGIIIESVGLAAVAYSIIIYGAGIVVASALASGSGSVLAGPLTIVLGAAFWWKRHQLRAEIKRMSEL